jgi:Flp pilus assembly protein TadG
MEGHHVTPMRRRAPSGTGNNGVRRGQPLVDLRRRRRGVAIVWMAIFLFVLIGIVELSLDWAKRYFNSHQLHNAADAAALAGAQFVRFDQAAARRQAITIAGQNAADRVSVTLRDNPDNAADGDVVVGWWDKLNRTFTPTTLNPNAVRVTANRTAGSPDGPVPLNFGAIAGVTTTQISRVAVARSTGATGAGLLALSPTGTGLLVSGNPTLDVMGGDIQVDSYDSRRALRVNGNAAFVACDWIRVCGEAAFNPPRDPEEEPYDLQEGADYIGDPLLNLPAPVVDPAKAEWADRSPSKGEAYTNSLPSGLPFGPGYYSGGFRFTTEGLNAIFKPGVYVVDGQGLYMNGGNLTAVGVMFYIVGKGRLYLGGNATITLRPPGCEGEPPLIDDYSGWQEDLWGNDIDLYKGISIFQARKNTNDSTIIGTAGYSIEGTLYFPANHIEVRGTAGVTFRPGNQLIASTIDISGNGVIQVEYDGRNMIEGFRSILVQ